jgi:hypothetical protein
MVIVLASLIVPSQANVTVPPSAIAACKVASVQLVTTPPVPAKTCSSAGALVTAP